MTSDTLATYGPMGSLSGGLTGQAEEWEALGSAASGGTGNPSLDAALGGLAGVVTSVSVGLGAACRTAGSGTQTVGGHFAVADT